MRPGKLHWLGSMLAVVLALASCNDNAGQADEKTNTASTPVIKEQSVTYTVDSLNMNSFIVYDSNSTEKKPVVLVVHEWWGLNDYVRNRARQLAEMGYVAMAVDMFGNGKQGNNPEEANALAEPFYNNPQLFKSRLDAALNKLKEHPQADASNVAAIGYCFGGSAVLNAAAMGADYKGVVSFHGGLEIAPPANLKSKVLVCHGGADPFVPQAHVDRFRKQMDSVKADYTFKTYDSATHAFTNPAATETGKRFNIPVAYNEKADKQSWEDMKAFLGNIFTKQ